MNSKIKHVAIMCQNAPRLSRFYEYLFALNSARAYKSTAAEDEAAQKFGFPPLRSKRVAKPYDATVIVTDGNIGLAFLAGGPAIRVASTTSASRWMIWTRCARE